MTFFAKNCCCQEHNLIRNNLYIINSGYYHQAEDCYGPWTIIVTSGDITAPIRNNWYTATENIQTISVGSTGSNTTRTHNLLDNVIKINGSLKLENFQPYKFLLNGEGKFVRGIGTLPSNFTRSISYTGQIPYSGLEIFESGYVSIQLPVGEQAIRQYSLIAKSGIYASSPGNLVEASTKYFNSSVLSPAYSANYIPCFVFDVSGTLPYDPQPLFGYNIIGLFNAKSGIESKLIHNSSRIILDPIYNSSNDIIDNSLSLEFLPNTSGSGYLTAHTQRADPFLDNVNYNNSLLSQAGDILGPTLLDGTIVATYTHDSGRSPYAFLDYTNTNIRRIFGQRILLYRLYDYTNPLDENCNVNGDLVLNSIRPTETESKAATSGEGSYLIVSLVDEASNNPSTTYPSGYWKPIELLKDYDSFVVDKTKPIVGIIPLDDILLFTSGAAITCRNQIYQGKTQVFSTEPISLASSGNNNIFDSVFGSTAFMYYSGLPSILTPNTYTLYPQFYEYNDETGVVSVVVDAAGNTVENNLSYSWTFHPYPSNIYQIGSKPTLQIPGLTRTVNSCGLTTDSYQIYPRSVSNPITEIYLTFDRVINPSGINNNQVTLTKNGSIVSGCNIISKDESNKNFIIQIPSGDQTSRSHWFLVYNPSGVYTNDIETIYVCSSGSLPKLSDARYRKLYITCDNNFRYTYSPSGYQLLASGAQPRDPLGYPYNPEPCVLASRISWIMEDINPRPVLVDTTSTSSPIIGKYTSIGSNVSGYYDDFTDHNTNININGGIFSPTNFTQISQQSAPDVTRQISCTSGTDIGSVCTWNNSSDNLNLILTSSTDKIIEFDRFPNYYGTLSGINIAATGYYYGNPGFSITNNTSSGITIQNTYGNLQLYVLGDNCPSGILASGNIVYFNTTPSSSGTVIAPGTTQSFTFTNTSLHYSNIPTTSILSYSGCFIRNTENAPKIKLKFYPDINIIIDGITYNISNPQYVNTNNIIIAKNNSLSFFRTRLLLQYIYGSSGKVLQTLDNSTRRIGSFTRKLNAGYTPSVTPLSGTPIDCSYFNLTTTIDPSTPNILGLCSSANSEQKHASSIRCSGDITNIETELLALNQSGVPLSLYRFCMCTGTPDTDIRLLTSNNFSLFGPYPQISGYYVGNCDTEGYRGVAFLLNNPISYTNTISKDASTYDISQNVWKANNWDNINVPIRPLYYTSGIFVNNYFATVSGSYFKFSDSYLFTSGEYVALGSPSGGDYVSLNRKYNNEFRRYSGNYILQDISSTISSSRKSKEFYSLKTTTLRELNWIINNYLTIDADIYYANKLLPPTMTGLVTLVAGPDFSGNYTIYANFTINDSEMVNAGVSGNYHRIIYDTTRMNVIFSKEKEDALASGEYVNIPLTFPVQNFTPNYWLKIRKL